MTVVYVLAGYSATIGAYSGERDHRFWFKVITRAQ